LNSKNKYRSILRAEPAEFREKGSKFVGLATWVKSEDQIKDKLAVWRKEYPQASHICYAYRLGVAGEIYRANDDGEPNNSAGAPILGQLIAVDLTNTLIGVVRYYGGTKLGVGGLVSAYKEAAKRVISSAQIVEFQLHRYYKLAITYLDMPHVLSLLKRKRIEIIKNDMTYNCILEIELEIDDEQDITELLSRFAEVEITDLGIK